MDPVDFVRLKLTKLFRGKVDKKISIPLGVYLHGENIYFIFQNRVTPGVIDIAKSENEFSFSIGEASLSLTRENKNTYLGTIRPFTLEGKQYLLCKNRYGLSLGTIEEHTLRLQQINTIKEKAVIVNDLVKDGKKVMYTGERAIYTAYSPDLIHWQRSQKPVLIGAKPIETGSVFNTPYGILLLYFQKETEQGVLYHNAHLALFDKNNPEKLLWKKEEAIWKQKEHWAGNHAHHLGTVFHKGKLISYWQVEEKGLFGVLLTGFTFDPYSLGIQKLQLEKHENNPIISPKSDNTWEAFNTFNPAALYVNKKVHILYRAQGFDYVSTVGYAASNNGVTIDERSPVPVFKPHADFESNKKQGVNYDFMSGGGMGGCEDPRVTLLGNRIYMTYVAFDGWSPPRLALTSILLSDFLNKKWIWSKPVLISPPGIIDKSGCLLPEKINGKYVFFHRVFPNILIDFVDDLNFDGKTKWLKGQYQIKIRDNMWDSRKIGAGAPPLKTKDGWLLIYYGVDDKDASKYHIGAMLLDLKDPTKVLHRTNQPILQPTDEYENNGFKPGIAYPCGAVIVKDKLLVYYGGADSVVCVATANLDSFLEDLKTKESGTLTRIQVQEIDY